MIPKGGRKINAMLSVNMMAVIFCLFSSWPISLCLLQSEYIMAENEAFRSYETKDYREEGTRKRQIDAWFVGTHLIHLTFIHSGSLIEVRHETTRQLLPPHA